MSPLLIGFQKKQFIPKVVKNIDYVHHLFIMIVQFITIAFIPHVVRPYRFST